MIRLTWRQFRTRAAVGLGLLLVYAAFVIATGIHGEHSNPQSLSSTVLDLVRAGVAVPFLLGMFWGAPLLGEEYEGGTTKLVWTQGISRRKWLTVKIFVVLLAAGVYGAAFAALYTWWLHANQLSASRFQSFDFDLDGIVPIFYSMFAVALGVALGAWRRRTLVAVGATLVIFAIFRGAVPTYVRPYYMKPVTLTYTRDPKQSSTPAFLAAQEPGNWLVATHGVDEIVYQPGNRYWEFQGIEAAIYLGLTTIAVGATYRIVVKRDA